MKYGSALILLALAGCGGKDSTGDTRDSDDPGVDPGLSEATFEVDPQVQTTLHVRWSSEAAGTSTLEFGLEGGTTEQVAATSAPGTTHEVTVVGLKSSGVYTMKVVTVLDGDGTRLEGEATEVEIPPVSRDMPRATVSEVDASRSAMATGYALMTTLGQGPSMVGILDGDGDWVFWQDVDPTGAIASARAQFSLDGRSVHYNVYQANRREDLGGIRTVALDGSSVAETRTLWAHHDFVEPEPGKFDWVAYDLRDVVVSAGPTEPPEGWVPEEPQPIAGDVIYEGQLGLADSDTPRTIGTLFDRLQPTWTCTHNTDKSNFVPQYFDWLHGNSLAYVASEDALYYGSRYQDALFKIERSTGEILWQMGGVDLDGDGAVGPADGNDFTLTSGRPWNHAHLSHVWEGGMLVFDNRDHAEGSSRVAEFAWDEAAKTYEEVWSAEREGGGKLLILGDARRLDNGNTLIAWSARGEIEEITPEGDTVWKANFDLGNVMTRINFLPSLR